MSQSPVIYPAGSYKVLKDSLLHLWDPKIVNDYAERYEKALHERGAFPSDPPLGYRVKEGQEIAVTYGDRKTLVLAVGDPPANITALTVTVKVGSKTYTGITLAYDDNVPSIVDDYHSLRPVKKRAK